MSNVIIRPFIPADRQAVRKICADTADKGGPVENFFPERESITDVLCGYYTDVEPQALFVAERDNEVVGYIMGCFDNRRYGLAMAFIIIPQALWKAFCRGVFFKAWFWALIRVMLSNWRRLFSWRKESFHSHQCHLHLGVAEGARHQGLGAKLLGALASYAKSRSMTALSASVHDGNTAAVRFFEQQGFKAVGRYPMQMYRDGRTVPYHSLAYVKEIVNV